MLGRISVYCTLFQDGRTFAPLKFRGLDNMVLAGKVAEVWRRTGADALFVDAGGGSGVIDRLRQLNVPVAEIAFGGKADRPRFNDETVPAANKRAEMWAAVRAFILPLLFTCCPRPSMVDRSHCRQLGNSDSRHHPCCCGVEKPGK